MGDKLFAICVVKNKESHRGGVVGVGLIQICVPQGNLGKYFSNFKIFL